MLGNTHRCKIVSIRCTSPVQAEECGPTTTACVAVWLQDVSQTTHACMLGMHKYYDNSHTMCFSHSMGNKETIVRLPKHFLGFSGTERLRNKLKGH